MTLLQTSSTGARDGAASLVDLKSVTVTLVAVVLKTANPDALSEALRSRIGGQTSALDNDPVVIDLSCLHEVAEPVDFAALVAVLGRHGLHALAVRGGSAQQMRTAAALGLVGVAVGTPGAVARWTPVAVGAAPGATASARPGADPKVILTEVISEPASLRPTLEVG